VSVTGAVAMKFALHFGGLQRAIPPRLVVLEIAKVDRARRLVLVRRDQTEHLLLIGGPSDVVLETRVVRNVALPAKRADRNTIVAPEPAPVAQLRQTLPPLVEALSRVRVRISERSAASHGPSGRRV
jgi:flagellar protein FliO/FliZ